MKYSDKLKSLSEDQLEDELHKINQSLSEINNKFKSEIINVTELSQLSENWPEKAIAAANRFGEVLKEIESRGSNEVR